MIKTLYPIFQHWSEKGSVYIFSDPHFDDWDCKIMNPNWINPNIQIACINSLITRNDYLILLGDIGNEERLKEIKCKNIVLITGNHDKGNAAYVPYCKEIYNGPLFIADRILLSHEPINGLENFCVNIHGHCHNSKHGMFGLNGHVNLAADVCNYTPYSLKDLIVNHKILAGVENYHRLTIDQATIDSIKEKS